MPRLDSCGKPLNRHGRMTSQTANTTTAATTPQPRPKKCLTTEGLAARQKNMNITGHSLASPQSPVTLFEFSITRTLPNDPNTLQLRQTIIKTGPHATTLHPSRRLPDFPTVRRSWPNHRLANLCANPRKCLSGSRVQPVFLEVAVGRGGRLGVQSIALAAGQTANVLDTSTAHGHAVFCPTSAKSNTGTEPFVCLVSA